MTTTRIPGFRASHQVIMPTCRSGRGDVGAAAVVLEATRNALFKALSGYGQETNTSFHVVVTIAEPNKAGSVNQTKI